MAKTTISNTAAKLNPVIVLAGDDEFLRREALAEIRAAVIGDSDPGMAVANLGAATDMAVVLDECRTMSMFAPRKLVIVDPAEGLIRSGRGGGGEENEDDSPADGDGAASRREILERYVESPSESATLVLVCESWLKTTRLHKMLDPKGAVRWCLPIREQEAPSWIAGRARQTYEKSIEPRAAARLAEFIGPDRSRLDNELAKLALYQPDAAAITLDAVEKLVGFQHEQKIWELFDALTAKNLKQALMLIDELWQMDEKNLNFRALGAAYIWLGKLLRASEMLDAHMPDAVVTRNVQLFPPDHARAVINLARRLGPAGRARWSRALLDADVANKSSLGTPRLNLEKFAVMFCTAGS